MEYNYAMFLIPNKPGLLMCESVRFGDAKEVRKVKYGG